MNQQEVNIRNQTARIRDRNMMIVIGLFGLAYVLGVVIGNKDIDAPLTVILRMRNSRYYLFPWLVRNYLYFLAMIVSFLSAIFSKSRLSYCTCAGAIIGILIGELLGPDPANIYGHTHNGWWIWIVTFIGSILLGVVLEIFTKKKSRISDTGGGL